MMYRITTVPHPHGHWQLQELLGNHSILPVNDLVFEIKSHFFGVH